ncbi:MAG: hypothetical protein KTR28_07565 [Micavibrio sp.]|nr:hypothetical protein [Micavibrio sp.]
MSDFIVKNVACLAVSALILSSCGSLREPDNFAKSRTRVQPTFTENSMPSAEMNEGAILTMAEHYHKHGKGPFGLTVTYDPASRTNTAMQATNKASDIAQKLRKEGVSDVAASILPVSNSANGSKVIISYSGYTALAPENCELMPGIDTRHINANADYQMGCSIDTLFARQVARPKDLVGQENALYGDARRVTNQTEALRGGEEFGTLGGERASGN